LVFSTVSDDICLGKNPFLEKLKTSSTSAVEIFEKVQNGQFRKCSEIWNQHGTCCDLPSLIKHAIADKIMISKNLNELKVLLKSAFIKLSTLWEIVSKPSSYFNSAPQIIIDLINRIKADNPHLNLENLNATINVLNRVDTINCTNALSNIRGGALCEICSGMSHHSFLSNKALINTQVCLSLYEQCKYQISAPVIFFGQISKIMKPIMEEIRKCSEKSQSLSDNGLGHIAQYLDLVKLAHLEELKKMAKLIDFDSHNLTSKISFCEKLISIVDAPSFMRIESDIEVYNSNLEKVIEVIKDAKNKKGNHRKFHCSEDSTGGSPESRRLLQNWDQGQGILFGDLIVVPPVAASIDSAYTSYLGAVGTSNHGSNLNTMPMNITHHLP